MSATPSDCQDTPARPSGSTTPGREPLLTVPNLLCAFRLFTSPLLVVLAWFELSSWCLGLFVILLLTDWLDGKIARWLKQETLFGTRLDSFADMTFYGCVLLALVALRTEMMRQEAIWIALALSSYAVSVAAGWIKFDRVPSYHTRLAKTSWLLVGVGVVSAFAGGTIWLFRLALGTVVLTNLEATAITLVLPEWRVNVSWLFQALRERRGQNSGSR